VPINKDELDEAIEIPWKKMFESMEEGKYYSINEMSQKIIGEEIIGPEATEKYLNPERRKTALMEYILPKLAIYLDDMAYVWAVLMSLVAVGKLNVGYKDKMPYFCKKQFSHV
jgi:hypothetical protein